MNKKAILTMVVFTVLVLLFPGFVHGAIPAAERAALIALYNSTNGDNWINKNGWKTPPLHTDGFAKPGTEGSWYGVYLSGDHVYAISFYNNNLSGSIPSQLGNLSNLLHLNLCISQLSSIPSQLGNLMNLKILRLNDNQLSGSIPAQLGNLSNLEYLELYNNRLSGSIPSELGNLSKLESLSLGYNQLSGSIPAQLGNLSNLSVLILEQNQLSGSIPSQLGNLSVLEELKLSLNQLSGSIPSQLGNLSVLEELKLSWNQLSGSIPAQLGNLSNLQSLNLSYNQLSGSIPAELGNLSKLKSLTLSDNQLSGSIPLQLCNLSNLETLSLDGNQLSGSIPAELGNLNNLFYLILTSNQLSGSIPSQLGNLSNLINLYLGGNQLSGSIPAELGNLSNLESLYLFENQLRGSVPLQLVNLSKLKRLALGSNQLSGSIPSQLGNLSKLNWLYLEDNQLSGTIPSQLGNLSNLLILSLNNNQLSGLIPSSFTNLTKIPLPDPIRGCYLDVGNNCLSATDSTLRDWLNSHDPDWESHQNQCGGNTPGITLSRTNLYFGTGGQSSTNAQTVLIGNSGSGTLNWSAAANVPWLSLNPSSGTNASVLSVSVNPAGLAAGTYTGTISITAPNATNSPQVIAVQLQVYNPGTTTVPFGDFATPVEGSSTFSSVPVTGWALDDTGIANVKIYNGDAYVGDAVFIEGARPDIEQAYPGYPNNYKAGWGYMMLTHFLPGGGNGTYTLVAKATDMEGNEVTLGTRTITIDNAHAVKPFGAIDTPGQGGTATGSAYRNQGWVLTPQPNHIPTDGSTIDVWIDGVPKGHPTYNIYRPDVASLFPGYANSNGAAGYFDFDTTVYENGVHSIFWTAADNAGNTDGIGSRYFTIQNLASSSMQENYKKFLEVHEPFFQKGSWPPEALLLQRGYSTEKEPETLYPDENGQYTIEIKELERLVIYLYDPGIQSDAGEYEIRPYKGFRDNGEPHVHPIISNSHLTLKNTPSHRYEGYLVNGDDLKPLPIGSTLDHSRGVFYWQPGPGFLGRYTLVFVLTESNGETFKKFIDIDIVPKFKGKQ